MQVIYNEEQIVALQTEIQTLVEGIQDRLLSQMKQFDKINTEGELLVERSKKATPEDLPLITAELMLLQHEQNAAELKHAETNLKCLEDLQKAIDYTDVMMRQVLAHPIEDQLEKDKAIATLEMNSMMLSSLKTLVELDTASMINNKMETHTYD